MGHWWQTYLGDVTVANISKSFTYKMATKTIIVHCSCVGIARKVCRAAFMKLSGVRPSVRQSVPSCGRRKPLRRLSCCKPGSHSYDTISPHAKRRGAWDIDRLLHVRRSETAATQHGAQQEIGQCHAVSRRRKLNTACFGCFISISIPRKSFVSCYLYDILHICTFILSNVAWWVRQTNKIYVFLHTF